MLIRQATPQDAGHIVDLVRELVRNENEECALTPEGVQVYLDQSGCVILLAEEAGCVLGLLCYSCRYDLYHAGKTGLIELLVVEKEARGKGIGSALIQETIRRGREEGWAEISVSTMPDNQAAVAFYRKHGLVDEAILLEMHL